MSFGEFIKAIEREDFDEVETLFKPEFINKKRKDGYTPLHLACMTNDETKIVKYLLNKNFNIEEKSVYGMKCIHLSAMRGNVKIIKALIKAECSLDSLSKTGKSALDLATNEECENILKAAQPITYELDLLKRYRLTKIVEFQTGKTLLDKLLSTGNPDILQKIKEKEVTDEEIKKWQNLDKTKVNLQSYKLIQECMLVRCIIHKYDNGIYDLCTADMVNEKSNFMSITALELAVECEVSVITFKYILRKIVKVDETWRKAENIARRKNQGRILSLIEERREYLKSQEKNGFSRLQVATIEKDVDMIQYLLDHPLENEKKISEMIDDAVRLSRNIGHSKCENILKGDNVDEKDAYMKVPIPEEGPEVENMSDSEYESDILQ